MSTSQQPRRPSGTPVGGQFDHGAGGGAAANLGADPVLPPAEPVDGTAYAQEYLTHGVGVGALVGMHPRTARRILDDPRADEDGWVAEQVDAYHVWDESSWVGRVDTWRAGRLAEQAAAQYRAAADEHAAACAQVATYEVGQVPEQVRHRMKVACKDTETAIRREVRAHFDLAVLRGEDLADDASPWEIECMDEARNRAVMPGYRGALRSTLPRSY